MTWGGGPMAPCMWSRCLTMPTPSWVMQCPRLHGPIPTKTQKGQSWIYYRSTWGCHCCSKLPLSPLPPNSTLGRIIRLTQEVIDYREWIIKKWGGRDVTRADNRGRPFWAFVFHSLCAPSAVLYTANVMDLNRAAIPTWISGTLSRL